MSPHDDLLARFAAIVREAEALGDPALLEQLRVRLQATPDPVTAGVESWQGILGRSPVVLAMRAQIQRFAAVKAPVLVIGESGTGKELVAKALHTLSPRRDRPFVAENCAAIPETLLESVLFGHKKGAVTGAIKDHPGHFVAADGGTLFLDEIGDMPLSMQVKLLRAIQESEIRAVGATQVRKVDVRLIAATNKDLAAEVKRGRFREDLFYRLNVLLITVPPLRERGDDILILARVFLAEASRKNGREVRLSPDAEEVLRAAPWPGNVRQLQNEMQRLAALCDTPVAGRKDLVLEKR